LVAKTLNAQWNFIPQESALIVPQAKVYLKQKDIPAPTDAKPVQPNDPKRYRMTVNILSLEGVEPSHYPLKASLFIVKGNPLIVSSTPLPCFSSGTDVVTLDLRPGEDFADLSLQVIAKDMDCHFAVPIDEIIEYASRSGPVERTITMWDAQTGLMRGSCMVSFKVEREQPLSISEIVEIRKLQSNAAPSLVQENSSFEPLVDLLAEARAADRPLSVLKAERDVLVEESGPKMARRRRGGAIATTNFSVNNDVINTVIPEDAIPSDS